MRNCGNIEEALLTDGSKIMETSEDDEEYDSVYDTFENLNI